MNYAKIIIPVILLSICSCKEDTAHLHLERIDSLCNTQYDSALIQIRQIDVNTLGRSDRMYLELIRGKAMNKAGVPFTTDSVMKKVVSYYDRHGSSNQRMLAHYVLGCAYRDMQSAPKALDEYRLAVEAADTLSADCDLSTLMRVHAQMAGIYELQRLTDRQEREDSIAEQLAWQTGDTLSALIFEENLCSMLLYREQYDKAVIRITELYKKFRKFGFDDDASIVSIHLAKAFLAMHDHRKAKKWLDIYESSSLLSASPENIIGGCSALCTYKAIYYREVGRRDSAEHYFQEALFHNHPHRDNVLIYKEITDFYHAQGRPDSVMKYAALYAEEKERIFNEENSKALLQTAAMYDYSQEQKNAMEEHKKNETLKNRLLQLSFIVGVMIVAVMYFLFRKERDKRRIADMKLQLRHLQDEKFNAQVTLSRLSEEKNAIERDRAEGKELSNRLLIEKEKNIELIEEQNRRVESLEAEIAELQEKLQIPNDGNDFSPLLRSDIVLKIKDIVQNPTRCKMKQTDWFELKKTIGKEVGMFYSAMNKNKVLTENEYRICMLSLIGIPPAGINMLMEMSESYSTITKKRLHVKIFNSKGSAADFDRKIGYFLKKDVS